MGRIVTWIGKNADGLLALAIAGTVVVLNWLDALDASDLSGATLVVLAVLSGTILRERALSRSLEEEIQGYTAATTAAHTDFGQRLAAVEQQIGDTRTTLEHLSMVRVLTGREVTHALSEARRDTDRWLFKGGTGTYMRAVTLPECVANARLGQRALLVRLEIVDPNDEDACNRYARFRRSLSSQPDGTGETWSFDRVRKESLATVLAGAWWRHKYDLLDVEIALSNTVSTLRWDLSSSSVIITQESPLGPALMIEHGRYYYDRLSTELRTSHDQAHKVPLELAKGMMLSLEPTIDQTQKFFAKIGMPLPATFTDRDIADVVRKAVKPKNPYDSELPRPGP